MDKEIINVDIELAAIRKVDTETELQPPTTNFLVLDEAGDVMVSATNNDNGAINFPAFTVTDEGEFNYTIRPEPILGCDWVTDPDEFQAIVTVTRNPEDATDIRVDINYPVEPIFMIRYAAKVVCPAIGSQKIDMCVPVHVRPFVNVSDPRVKCCGRATVRPGTDMCDNMPPLRDCGFTISQSICVEVPALFGADVDAGEPHGQCQQVSEENLCIDCDNNA